MKILNKFLILIAILTVFLTASQVDARRISIEDTSGSCPSGYELSQLSGEAYECTRIETCDQYGNGWPRIGVDTEVDARFTLCNLDPASNIVTASLSASPSEIYSGDTSVLSWGSVNATTCSGAGFLTGGSVSGTISVSPNSTTQYSVTCTGTTGSAVATAEVSISGSIDLVPSKPSLNSGDINGAGNNITFKSLITNTGSADVTDSIPTSFELDINNDGSFDVTLTSDSLSGLNGGQSKQINSSEWTTQLGTHSVRAIVDPGVTVSASDVDSSGCYTVSPSSWEELIGTEGCSTSGGPNACGLQFDPQSLYATIGTTYTVVSTSADGSQLVCPSYNDFCFDSGIGGETGSFNELRQSNMEGDICLSGSSTSNAGTDVFSGTQKDAFTKYRSIITKDISENGITNIGNADFYTGSKTGGKTATLDHICKLIDPNSKLTDYNARSYNSPGNNSIMLWNGKSWEKHGARSYNSHVSGPFTCTAPPAEITATGSGELSETNEENNYSPLYVFTVRQPQCSDGIDNDNDGFTDYPDDSDCSSSSGSGSGSEGNTTQCSDGVDNDGDGTTDLLDSGCSSAGDDSESGDLSSSAPQVDISANTTLVRSGTDVTISWTAVNVNSCTVSGPSISKSYSTNEVSDQSDVEIKEKSIYTITCDTDSGTVSDSVSVGIVPSFIEE